MSPILAWVRWRSTAARRAEAERLIDETPPEDVEPVARYLYAMCGQRGHEVGSFALSAILWLHSGELVLPRGARRLSRADRKHLPQPYSQRTPAA